jgi:hypothetical protein
MKVWCAHGEAILTPADSGVPSGRDILRGAVVRNAPDVPERRHTASQLLCPAKPRQSAAIGRPKYFARFVWDLPLRVCTGMPVTVFLAVCEAAHAASARFINDLGYRSAFTIGMSS